MVHRLTGESRAIMPTLAPSHVAPCLRSTCGPCFGVWVRVQVDGRWMAAEHAGWWTSEAEMSADTSANMSE